MPNQSLSLKSLKYVLFDWDNTLAESRIALVTVVNQVLAEYHMPNWDIVKKRRDAKLSFRDNFPNIFGDELAPRAYRRYAELYLQQVPSLISTFPCVPEVLEFFRCRGVPMLIMSNKDRRLLDAELPLLFSPSLFARIVAGHEAPHDKPYREHILYSLEGLLKPEEITPENVWMIGDSAQDSDCALAANALPIRIGEPIWHDDNPKDGRIKYFHDFKAFYQALIAAGC